jgi:hypothetical protein
MYRYFVASKNKDQRQKHFFFKNKAVFIINLYCIYSTILHKMKLYTIDTIVIIITKKTLYLLILIFILSSLLLIDSVFVINVNL